MDMHRTGNMLSRNKISRKNGHGHGHYNTWNREYVKPEIRYHVKIAIISRNMSTNDSIL